LPVSLHCVFSSSPMFGDKAGARLAQALRKGFSRVRVIGQPATDAEDALVPHSAHFLAFSSYLSFSLLCAVAS
jgi:hypothetical protein